MSLRSKLILYLIGIHLVFAGLAGYLLREEKPWLLGIEAFFILSFAIGLRLIQHFWVPLDLIRTGAELIGERDFTSKFVEVGQPEMDQLVRVYNRMIDQLREERTRLQEQHYFMDKILTASPSGIITLDFDDKIALVNPSASRLLGLAESAVLGRPLDELGTAFAHALHALAVGESQVLPLQGQRVRCHKAQFLDRGFPRSFILMEELTEELRLSEKAAYEKVIRLLAHEVNNSTGAVNSLLHSCLNYKGQLREADRGDFENALQVAIDRIDHLSAFMRSFAEVVKLPAPPLAARGPRSPSTRHCSANARRVRAPQHRVGLGYSDGPETHSHGRKPDGAGVCQYPEKCRRGHWRKRQDNYSPRKAPKTGLLPWSRIRERGSTRKWPRACLRRFLAPKKTGAASA